MTQGEREVTAAEIQKYLVEEGIEFECTDEYLFILTLPGEAKLRTTLSLSLGEHAATINAFVARRPDDNHGEVNQWLLERNRRMYAVAFCLDHLGDIYLTGRLPLASLTRAELDRVLGAVLEYSDASFNTILELGFANSIKREWAWRTSRGMSTENLRAFTHLAEPVSGKMDP